MIQKEIDGQWTRGKIDSAQETYKLRGTERTHAENDRHGFGWEWPDSVGIQTANSTSIDRKKNIATRRTQKSEILRKKTNKPPRRWGGTGCWRPVMSANGGEGERERKSEQAAYCYGKGTQPTRWAGLFLTRPTARLRGVEAWAVVGLSWPIEWWLAHK